MPKMPDWTSIQAPSTAVPTGPIGNLGPGIGGGLRQLAAGLGGLGSRLGAEAKRAKAKSDNLAYLEGDAKVKEAARNYEAATIHDPEARANVLAVSAENVQPDLMGTVKAEAEKIQDPYKRKQFLIRNQAFIQREGARYSRLLQKQNLDKARAELFEDLEADAAAVVTQDTMAREKGWEKGSPYALIEARIDRAQELGLVSAKGARELKNSQRDNVSFRLAIETLKNGTPEEKAELRSGITGKPMSPGKVNASEKSIQQFFINKGLTAQQAAGIVGNLIQESGLRTQARNKGDGRDGSDSIGVAQWNGARARRLKAYAKANGTSPYDLKTQLEFIWVELNSTESKTLARLKAARNSDEAAAAFIGYERPKGWSANNPRGGHGWVNRLKHAIRIGGGKASSREVQNIIGNMSPRRRAALERAIRTQDARDIRGLRSDLRNYEAGLFTPGVTIPEGTRESISERITTLLPPEQAARLNKRLADAESLASTLGGLRSMGPKEISAARANLSKKKDNEPLEAQLARAKRVEQFDKAVKRVQVEREKTPVRSAIMANPATTEAFTSFTKALASRDMVAAAELYTAYKTSVSESLQKLGISHKGPLIPQNMLDNMASGLDSLRGQSNGNVKILAALRGMKSALGNDWAKVFSHIAKKSNLPREVFISAEISDPKYVEYGRELIEAGRREKAIDERLQKAKIDSFSLPDIRKSIENNKEIRETRFSYKTDEMKKAISESIELLVKKRIDDEFQKTGKVSDLDGIVQKAYKDILGHKWSVVRGGLRIPSDIKMTTDQIDSLLVGIKKTKWHERYNLMMPKRPPGEKLSQEAINRLFIERISDPSSIIPVMSPDGRSIIISYPSPGGKTLPLLQKNGDPIMVPLYPEELPTFTVKPFDLPVGEMKPESITKSIIQKGQAAKNTDKLLGAPSGRRQKRSRNPLGSMSDNSNLVTQ